MRTNIDIDDKLMRQAMRATGAKTKRAAVDASLRKLIEVRAREAAQKRIFRRQERERQVAIREGRLDQWFAELVKRGNTPEAIAHANKHRD
ncbi:MAG: type II toxin-antitoxin system VapB family antitoxin [Terracidiphilus sp.]